MNPERCVLYVNTIDTASRSSIMVVDGKYRVPVTLPKIKCLEVYSDKYFPYSDNDPVVERKLHQELFKGMENISFKNKECSERELKCYAMSKNGMSVKDIASFFNTSNDTVRGSIVRARIKLGEIPEHRVKSDHNREENLRGRDLSESEHRIYNMHNNGISNAEIAERLGIKRGQASDALRRAKMKVGNYR